MARPGHPSLRQSVTETRDCHTELGNDVLQTNHRRGNASLCPVPENEALRRPNGYIEGRDLEPFGIEYHREDARDGLSFFGGCAKIQHNASEIPSIKKRRRIGSVG